MANVNAPFGLRPVRYASGAPYNGAFKEYFATGATGAIYKGDCVVLAGSANTTEVQGRAPGTLPTVTVAADGDGDPILGVCVGVEAVTSTSVPYRENSTDRIILVADDPNLVFVGQCDTAGTDWAATDVGSYANMLVGTGNTYTGLSGWTLDTTDGPDNADPSNQLLIVGLYPAPDNEIGEYGRWLVMINNHQLANVGDAGRFTGV
jgi:hypothetical protein